MLIFTFGATFAFSRFLKKPLKFESLDLEVSDRRSDTMGPPAYGNAFPHISGDPSRWGCIPTYWGAPVYGIVFPYIWVPQSMGMHSHILGCPSTRECSTIYRGTPEVPQYMERHTHVLGYPLYVGMYSHTLGYPNISGNAFSYTEVPQYTQLYLSMFLLFEHICSIKQKKQREQRQVVPHAAKMMPDRVFF